MEIGRVTGMSRTAVAARIAALRSLQLVGDGSVLDSSGGRPAASLVFDKDAGVVLAAAIGRSRSQLAICDLAGSIRASTNLDHAADASPEDVLGGAVERFRVMLRQVGTKRDRIRGFGCSIPAVVDIEHGASVHSPLMAGWEGVAVAPYLQKLAKVPVLVDNDATVLALSEQQALLRTYRNVLMIKASTGFGAGIVVDGRVLRGGRGAAGEIGHVKVAAAKGLACRCGDTGCLEAVAGGWVLVKKLQDQGRSVAHVRDLVGLAVDGDAESRRLLRESGRRLGEVVGAAVNLLNPDAVVIGGDLVGAYDVLVAGLRETLYATATTLATQRLDILPATHGVNAGVVGCAAMAIEHLLRADTIDELLAQRA
jgi:predicted NBD/HSP70 family sugar kinase